MVNNPVVVVFGAITIIIYNIKKIIYLWAVVRLHHQRNVSEVRVPKGGSTNSNRLINLMGGSGKFLHHQRVRNNHCCNATYGHSIKCNLTISLTA